MTEITLTENSAATRLYKVLKRHLKNAPDSFIYKMLRKKNITLNSKKATGDEITKEGDTVQFFLAEETYKNMVGESTNSSRKIPKNFPEIKVLSENRDFLIFIKPQGILSQKAADSDYSINEWVIDYSLEKGLIDRETLKEVTPSVCNRLDRNTGGIMTAGLSLPALKFLSEIFRERTVKKYYYALVKGRITERQVLNGFLIKDEKTNKVTVLKQKTEDAALIITEYEPIKVFNDRTLLKIHLLTGRSHQIRAHLSSIGHPILGDPKYGDKEFNKKYRINYQCLFSYRIEFPECMFLSLSEKAFEAEIPADWPV